MLEAVRGHGSQTSDGALLATVGSYRSVRQIACLCGMRRGRA